MTASMCRSSETSGVNSLLRQIENKSLPPNPEVGPSSLGRGDSHTAEHGFPGSSPACWKFNICGRLFVIIIRPLQREGWRSVLPQVGFKGSGLSWTDILRGGEWHGCWHLQMHPLLPFLALDIYEGLILRL